MNRGLDFLLIVLLAPITLLVRAWVLMKVWIWLLMPPFGLPSLPLSAAIGGSILLQLAHGSAVTEEDKERPALESVLASLLISLFALLTAWITKLIAY